MSEENQELEAKVQKYENILEDIQKEVVNKPGIITSLEHEGKYRVDVSGEDIIANSIVGKLKAGQQVIVAQNTIMQILPETLKIVSDNVNEDNFETVSWDDIGGIKSQLAKIKETVEYPIKYEALYKEFNLKKSKGIVLHGAPGCGKTMIAKAIASTIIKSNKKDFKDLFVYMKGGEVLSPFVGAAENKIKAIFENCRKVYKRTGQQPVLFLDEAEAILNVRGSGISSDVNKTVVPTFLAEMDGFEGNNPFVILSTNLLNKIDSAILRPGRIDLKLHIGRPSKEDSKDIFKIYLNKTKVEGSVDALAREATDLMFIQESLVNEASGALISNIVSKAIMCAIKRRIKDGNDKRGVVLEDIKKSIINF